MSARRLAHRDRQLFAGGALYDSRSDPVRQCEPAAEVVRALRADPAVGADRGDPVVLAQAGAGRPAVAKLLLLVDEGELLALVGLRLNATDLIRARLVVEQQHDQAAEMATPRRYARTRYVWRT